MKKLTLLLSVILCFAAVNICSAQIKFAYVKQESSLPDSLYVSGNLKTDLTKQDGVYQPDDSKAYIFAWVEMGQNSKFVYDEAVMNINGKNIYFKAKARRFRSDHDYPSGKIWLYSPAGYKLRYQRYFVDKENREQRLKLTVYYKRQTKSIYLVGGNMGD